MEKPAWIKDKRIDENFEIIRGDFDGYKDFVMDTCYVLIRVYHDKHEIGLAICDKEHIILKEFRGRIVQEIYNTLFNFQTQHNMQWITRMEHAAYIGKELKKAEIAMALSLEYMQE